MVQNTRYNSLCLLMLHAALLLFLSFYFLAREDYLLHYPQQRVPPLQFLLRFCAFWFVSIVFTLSVFLVYVQRYQLQIPAVQRTYAQQAGKYAFSIGMVATVLFFLLLYALFLR